MMDSKKSTLRSLCDDARNGPGKRLDICKSKVFFCTTTRSCGGSKYRKLNLSLMLGTLSKWSKETLEESHPGATIENDHTVESSGDLDIGRIQHA